MSKFTRIDDDELDEALRKDIRELAVKHGIVAEQPVIDKLYQELNEARGNLKRQLEMNRELVRLAVSLLLTAGGTVEVPPDYRIIPLLDSYGIEQEPGGEFGLSNLVRLVSRRDN